MGQLLDDVFRWFQHVNIGRCGDHTPVSPPTSLVLSLKLDFDCTNNQAEYEALVINLSVLHDLHAARVLVFGDSELVINQLNGTFRCMSCTLAPYHMVASYLAESFDGITFNHISRGWNTIADELAQIASEAQLLGGKSGPMIPVLRQSCPALVNQ
ncbi:uncharacterized protein [Malus domestica]|uniref:uncharacterized protein n=1 Tax=Malus domestica TaxID=3750 RepID=UPI003976333A